MSAARDSIKEGLMSLIARKDATVFQSSENFTREINKLGDWQNLPEIAALAAGLSERLPWELQKDGSGMVTGKSLVNLAGLLTRKHSISDNLAVWAVEAWATALGLKLESPAAKPPEAAKVARPVAGQTSDHAAKPGIDEKSNADGVLAYAHFAAKSRLGLIFGQDESGAIRVFASWFREATAQQSAGLAATMVKIEAQTERPLFSAPPARRKSGSTSVKAPAESAGSQTGTNRPAAGNQKLVNSTPASDPSAPALKKDISPGKTEKPVASPASRQTTAKPAASLLQSPPPNAAGKNKVYYGSAESLYNQAVQLLPGRSSKPDVTEALAMLNQAAKQGSIDARRAIGIIYMKGVGIKQDFATAANWLRLAADAGDAESQFHLGSLYQCGMGVEFSLEHAQNWLQRAAKQGHKEAEALLKEILQG